MAHAESVNSIQYLSEQSEVYIDPDLTEKRRLDKVAHLG